MPDLKVGDVVRLKSGGPSMTVMKMFDGGATVGVAWVDQTNALHENRLPIGSVNRTSDDSRSTEISIVG